MDIRERVEKIIEKKIDIQPHQLRDEVGASMWEVLTALPPSMACEIKINKTEDLYQLWERIDRWRIALLFVQTSGFVIDVNAKLPHLRREGEESILTIDWRNGLDAHIMLNYLGSVVMLNKPLFQRESLSFHFLTRLGDHMFAIYAGRDKDTKVILPEVYESYISIWNTYSRIPFVKHKIQP